MEASFVWNKVAKTFCHYHIIFPINHYLSSSSMNPAEWLHGLTVQQGSWSHVGYKALEMRLL
jgi:hypothetical protein